jgi:hypothetical protein
MTPIPILLLHESTVASQLTLLDPSANQQGLSLVVAFALRKSSRDSLVLLTSMFGWLSIPPKTTVLCTYFTEATNFGPPSQRVLARRSLFHVGASLQLPQNPPPQYIFFFFFCYLLSKSSFHTIKLHTSVNIFEH